MHKHYVKVFKLGSVKELQGVCEFNEKIIIISITKLKLNHFKITSIKIKHLLKKKNILDFCMSCDN